MPRAEQAHYASEVAGGSEHATRSAPARICLVTGAGGPAGRAAIRALRAHGYYVIAADMCLVEHEADEFHQVPPAASADFLSELFRMARICGASWLVPTVQEELLIVARHASALRRAGIAVFTSGPDAVASCHDKWLTVRTLSAHGVPVPRSAVAHSGTGAIRALHPPLVSKPRIGRSGRGVTVHDAPNGSTDRDDVIWQEFIGGTQYDALGLIHPDPPFRFLSLDVFAKTPLRDGRTGNGVELAPCVAGDVADLAVEAARALELTGPVDIDIRRNANGVPHVLEVNARIGAHAFSAPRLFDLLVVLHTTGHLGGQAGHSAVAAP